MCRVVAELCAWVKSDGQDEDMGLRSSCHNTQHEAQQAATSDSTLCATIRLSQASLTGH